MQEINIGKKIKDIRNEKGLSIKDLSEKTSISSSMLSQIERGLANPSINSLKMIAKILEVPVFTFFVEDNNVKDLVVRKKERKIMKFPSDNDFSYELLTPDLKGDIEFSIMTLNKSSKSSINELAHEGEEVSLVLEGKINLYINGEKIILNQGDSVKIPSRSKHMWENVYKKPCKVIFAITPPSF